MYDEVAQATILSALWKTVVGVKRVQRRKFSPVLIADAQIAEYFCVVMRKRIALQNIMLCHKSNMIIFGCNFYFATFEFDFYFQ
jgi:hypothetical protein